MFWHSNLTSSQLIAWIVPLRRQSSAVYLRRTMIWKGLILYCCWSPNNLKSPEVAVTIEKFWYSTSFFLSNKGSISLFIKVSVHNILYQEHYATNLSKNFNFRWNLDPRALITSTYFDVQFQFSLYLLLWSFLNRNVIDHPSCDGSPLV